MSGHHHRRFGWFAPAPRRIADWVLIYTVSGEGWLEWKSRTRAILPGDVVLLPAGSRYRYRSAPKSSWETFWVHFGGVSVRDWMETLLLLDGPRYPIFHAGIHEDVLELFRILMQVTDERQLPSVYLQRTQTLRYLICRMAHHAQGAMRPAEDRGFPMNKVRHILGEHLHTTIRVGDLAEACGMSVPHFHRRFRQETGTTPASLFMQMKLTRACEDLVSGDQKMETIANALGFSSAYHFSRCFKQHIGMPPSAYRKARRGSGIR